MVSHSRLFFALMPPHDLAVQLSQLAQRRNKEINGRVTSVEMIHMTLRYIGQTDDSIKHCLLTAASSLSLDEFTLNLSQIDFWKSARIVYCKPEPDNESLTELVKQLEKICQQCGLSAEKKSFKAHLSLLHKVNRFAESEEINLPLWKVKYFVLLESVSTAEGVRYKELKRWQFK